MRAVVRLNVMVAAAFMLALMLSLFGLMRQAKTDIERELASSMVVADLLITGASKDEALLESLITTDWRHLTIIKLPIGISPPSPSIEQVPTWFARWIWPEITPRIERRVLLDEEVLVLIADPEDELAEVWESALQVLVLFCGGALLSIAAISWGVAKGMRPFGQVLAAIDQIQQGRFTARLQAFSVPEANRLANHFNRMAQALEQEQDDNRRLTRELMALQEKERAYLARELHDDLGQYLTGIRAQAYLIGQTANRPELVATTAPRIVRDCEAMQQGFRRLIRSLHPVILEPLGLEESLRSLVEQWQQSSGIKCHLTIQDLPVLSDETSTHLYRLLQEALNNVARHACASRVDIGIEAKARHLLVHVADDGLGLADNIRPGVGIRSMHERARYMDAKLSLSSAPGGGLKLMLELPLAVKT
ncbi:sensor histidine kinase [Marinobacterium sediminicola]|uniref:histidine kinase n=1 Tax=Marinobacterium sediminicola TaxID=518898 RepID=A0ABY1RXE4_9GAMM|nr:histidine kinase [Marinobacterium sediminicola]ULG67750.1 histidine kinase [Marinobacterium sediminicola]SMR71604.1 two-component system, NarL family, sensor histidine kinase UhpB [Marinobacterium sediminicola]